jgi:hypothetical protein
MERSRLGDLCVQRRSVAAIIRSFYTLLNVIATNIYRHAASTKPYTANNLVPACMPTTHTMRSSAAGDT